MSYNAHGQFGFTFAAPGVPAGNADLTFQQRVLSASAPDPAGTTWGIHLAAWQGGFPRQTLGMKQLRARVTWGGGTGTTGVGGAGAGNEIALVDYPAQGTSFTVSGANVAVEIVGTVAALTSDRSPTLSGWLTQGRTSGHQMEATLTDPTQTFVGGSVGAIVPARARAYRIFHLTIPTNGAPIQGLQLDGRASPNSLHVDNVTGGAVGDQGLLAASRSRWWPLHPAASTIVFTATPTPPQPPDISVQWLLELG